MRWALAAALALVVTTALPVAAQDETSPGPAHAALADCGPGSAPEPGIQGWVPPAEPSYLADGYRCNLELLGQHLDGNGALAAWYEHCAYVAADIVGFGVDALADRYVSVFDVSDPANPRLTATLDTPGIVGAAENLEVNARRGLLAGGEITVATPVPVVQAGPWFDVYDLNDDCAHPRLLASVEMYEPGRNPHSGGFAPDGMTYYSTGRPLGSLLAIDLTDPTAPTELFEWSQDNLRADMSVISPHQIHFAPGDDGELAVLPDNGTPAGVVIADLGDLHDRVPEPRVEVVGQLAWADGVNAMTAEVGRIGDQFYAFVVDEWAPAETSAAACAADLPPYGFVHVVDITDPANPFQVSSIRLEINEVANCPTTLQEAGPGFRGGSHSPHWCTVDDPERTTALACSWMQSGVRVFDVRNPLEPVEIAYYSPPPRPAELPDVAASLVKLLYSPNPEREMTPSPVRWYRAEDGSWQLWFVSAYNGLQVVEFANGVYPLAAEVVRHAGPDRVQTAVAVSQEGFQSAGTVVLARADEYADALTGGPLAATVGAPLLLTASDVLSEASAGEIARLGASDVILLGGERAIGPPVEAELVARGLAVRRIAGSNRFATAAAVAAELGGDPARAFVAEGEHADPARGWPDALAASPYAAFAGQPILLVNAGRYPEETAGALAELAPDEVVVVGGEAAVDPSVTAAIAAGGHAVRRIAGDTRYATAAAVHAEAVAAGMDPGHLWLATGRDFPDALAAGPTVAALGHSLMLVDGQDLAASPATVAVLEQGADTISRVHLLGGEAAISQQVEVDVLAILAGTVPAPSRQIAAQGPPPTVTDVLLSLSLATLPVAALLRRRRN